MMLKNSARQILRAWWKTAEDAPACMTEELQVSAEQEA